MARSRRPGKDAGTKQGIDYEYSALYVYDMKHNKRPIAIQLSPRTIAFADRMAEKLTGVSSLNFVGRVTRSTVIRMAIQDGLERMREKYVETSQ